ncbi:MAG: hypothetical protein ACYCO0_01995 [Candidatus Micrarchaeaceae archaeon]
MTKQSELQILRKMLGIKKLKDRIPVTEFEKAAVENLRIKERLRLIPRLKQHA